MRTQVMGQVSIKISDKGCHLTTELMDVGYIPTGPNDGKVMLMSPEHKTYMLIKPKQFDERVHKLTAGVNQAMPKGWQTKRVSRKPGPVMFGHKTLCITYCTTYEKRPDAKFIDELYITPDIKVNDQEFGVLKQFLRVERHGSDDNDIGLPLKYVRTVNVNPLVKVTAIETKSLDTVQFSPSEFGPPKGYSLAKSDADVLMGMEDMGMPTETMQQIKKVTK